MGMFDWVGDAAKAVVHGVEDAAGWVGERADDVEHWFGDLFSGDLGAQAMSVPEIVEKVMASQGATDWNNGASLATDLASDHQAVATQIQNISSGLESVWTGSGAEVAQTRLKPLGEVADSAARTFNANSTHVTSIASGFDEMKRSLTPLPSSAPHKDFWDVATPWDTDTEDQVNQHNAQIQENLNRYNGYAQQAQDSGRQLSIDYGQIGTFDDNVTLAAESETNTTSHPTSTTGSTADTVSRLDVTPATPLDTGGTVTPAMAGASNASGGRSPESLTGDGTTASAYSPPAQTATTHGTTSYGTPSGSGRSPILDGLGGLGMGVAGGFAGTGGGAGSGNLSRGGGTPDSGRPGAGSRTGVGPHNVPGATAAAEKAGSTGRGGTGGLGAAGTGAGRGKGDEDEEHSRKYGIEDDSLFVDHGERLVDPETGLHVTPPIIGG